MRSVTTIIRLNDPPIITADKVKQDLIHMKLDIVVISTMHEKIEGTRIDMLIIIVPLTSRDKNKNIYSLTTVRNISIRVKSQRTCATLLQSTDVKTVDIKSDVIEPRDGQSRTS